MCQIFQQAERLLARRDLSGHYIPKEQPNGSTHFQPQRLGELARSGIVRQEPLCPRLLGKRYSCRLAGVDALRAYPAP